MTDRVAKITISLPVDLLGDIDGIAAESGDSRSFVIREAAVSYLASKRAADEAAARRRGVEAALALMASVRAQPVLDDRSTGELLREIRDGEGRGA